MSKYIHICYSWDDEESGPYEVPDDMDVMQVAKKLVIDEAYEAAAASETGNGSITIDFDLDDNIITLHYNPEDCCYYIITDTPERPKVPFYTWDKDYDCTPKSILPYLKATY